MASLEGVDVPGGKQWKCLVCKRVNVKPPSWTGKPQKGLRVVLKRKAIAKNRIYAEFVELRSMPKVRLRYPIFI